ncbi:MAG: hypothetical protein SWO11_16550 [Thermodesulfobacteriota bacterium]|nr:hypothetical protein [Thermodesulfobacteriota bacterium]
MYLGLTGKNIIAIGGASNIGRAISLLFAEEKANVLAEDWMTNRQRRQQRT